MSASITSGRSARHPRRWGISWLAAYYVVILTLLFLPIGLLALFAFNANTTLAFPLRGLTLDWFARVVSTPDLLDSARNSLLVAVGSSVVATALGTAVALLFVRFRFRGRWLLFGLSIVPLIVPAVVLAGALLVLFRAIDVDRSLLTVGIAHVVCELPFVVLIVLARLIGFDPQLEDAAMDLGATYPGALRRVVLPIIAPAMVAAGLTAFTVSFDEFAMALFLVGREPTFPVFLFGQLRFTTTLPIMIAMAVLLMAATIVMLLIAEAVRRRAT
jgi:spermidine/putrescine transport system permease protein